MLHALHGLAAPILGADFPEIFRWIIGVVLALAGLALVVMGGLALADRSWKSGGGAFAVGLALLVGGMWLVGALSS
jgi:hypothetical protein